MAIIPFRNNLKNLAVLFAFLGTLFLENSNLLCCPYQNDENQEYNSAERRQESYSNQGKHDPFNALKTYHRHKDTQISNLTRKSDFSTGEECARVRWVKDLDCYYGSKRPEKVVKVPADIHPKLQCLGETIKLCSTYINPGSQKNILVPYISYVIKDSNGIRKFVEGGFLKVNNGQRESRPIFFISGMKDWEIQSFYNRVKPSNCPSMQAIGGQYAQKHAEKPLDQLLNNEKHTERWFLEIINKSPESVVSPLKITPEKIYAIVIDMYSIWDVCEHCQKNFRREFFERSILKKVQEVLKSKGICFPRNGLKVLYRVSSKQPYGPQPITHEKILQAGGGYTPEKGFDIKAIDTAQVTFATRQVL